jgi:hypothetical protein
VQERQQEEREMRGAGSDESGGAGEYAGEWEYAWTKRVAVRQKRLLPSASSSSSSSSRLGLERVLLLRMNPFMGFANRFFAVTSALIMSLASERALIIDWPADAQARRHPNGESSIMPPLQQLLQLPEALDLQVSLSHESREC